MKNPKFSHAFEVVPELPELLQPIRKLASNYYWTWDHEVRDVFRSIDRDFLDSTDHNPVLFLNGLSKDRLAKLAADKVFIARLNQCCQRLESYLSEETWFDKAYPEIGRAHV